MANINLFSVNNGKITYNNISSEKVNSIIEKNKKKKLKELERSYNTASKVVANDTKKIGQYLNRNGQNVNVNNPFQANVVSNAMINTTKKNLNGRVTLQDVVQDHTNLMNTEKAQELKNNLRISKNERAWAGYNLNQAKVENEKTTFVDKTIGNVTRGISDLFSNMTDSRDIVDEKGNNTRLPSYSELKQQKVSEDYKTGIGKFLGDATYNISKIGASTLMNVPTLGVGGSAIYWSDMFADSYHGAKNQGYSEDKAFNYALVNTGFEFIVGKFLGSATKGLTGGQTSQLSNAISNGINKLISNPKMSSIIGNAGSEATEEFIQEYLDNINRLITLEGSTNAQDYIDVLLDKDILKDAIYSAGVGALSGGALGGINNSEGRYAKQNTDLFKNFKTQLEETKSKLTNKNEIAKYDKVISNIDEYLKRPFGNEQKVQNILPTVQDIVAQENTKKEVIGKIPTTSTMWEKPSTLTNSNTPSSTSKTKGSDISSTTTNNIAQSNDSVNKNQNREFLEDYDKNTEKVISLAERNVIVKNYKQLSKLVDEALDTNLNKAIHFGKLNETITQRIKAKLENLPKNKIPYLTKEKYDLVMNQSEIRHLIEDKSQMTREDVHKYVSLLPKIISEFDNASYSSEPNSEGVRFKKKLSDGTYISFVLVSNKHSTIKAKNIHLKKFDYEAKKRSISPTSDASIAPNRTSETDGAFASFSDNNIPQNNENVKLPVISNNNMQSERINNNKIMNPNEISKLKPQDANTTPILFNKYVPIGRGESKFAKNIENKTDMLTKESKYEILDSNEVKYYQEVTNKASLEKAFERLGKNGESETLNWFSKDSSKATDVDVAEGWILLKQYQDKIQNATDLATKDTETRNMVQVAKKLREMGTKAGQTVQAYNILNRLTPEGMVYYAQSELSEAFEVMSKNKTAEWIESNREIFNITPQETEFIMKTMQEVQQMEDGYEKRVKLAEIQKVMTDKLPPQRGAGIKAWMRISMLFNPKTQVRNVAGNAIIAPVNAFSDLFASAVDKQIAKKTGVRTTGTISVKNYFKGFGKGAYQSYNDFKKGINTRNIQGNRFEITEGKSFNDNNSIGKALNRVDSLLSFMLDAGDRTFYEATFTNSINNQLKLNNTTKVTQAMIDIATQEALSRTWQDNNNYTKFVLNVRKGLNAINVAGYGLGDVLIPFAKTPANLTKAIVDYSPAGMIKTINEGINLKKSLTNGQYTAQMQHQFVQDLGKATTGTMLYILGVALAKAGITSGESDDDKDVANFLKNTLGVSSYSIKIGKKSFTYDWAQPIAAPLAITANIVQNQKEGANLKENIMSSLDTAGNILLEQSFMESINTALNNNEGIATGIQEAIFELPARAIPTLFKQIADMIDGTQRQTFEKDKPIKSAFNYAKSKVPLLSKTLAPSVDTMGREIQKYGGKNNIFNVFLNPANVNTENISKSAEEIYRLYKTTGETNIMPRVAPYYINQDGKKINLNTDQREKYQKVSGKIIEDNINKLLKMSNYKNMSDKEKAEVINDIVNYSYNIAKKEVLGIELSNAYAKAEQYDKIGNISDYYTFRNSIDDTDKDTKRNSIKEYLVNSNLNDKQLAFLYGTYYSSEETLNNLINANIPIKEFIKFNSQEFTTDYYTNGKAVTNSRRNKVIKYVNSLNLSVAQKALLIKMEYNSYDRYDKQIVQYINSKNISFLEKASILKKAGFTNYDKQIINYVNKMNITKSEKEEMLKEMGFKIRNGRVYS